MTNSLFESCITHFIFTLRIMVHSKIISHGFAISNSLLSLNKLQRIRSVLNNSNKLCLNEERLYVFTNFHIYNKVYPLVSPFKPKIVSKKNPFKHLLSLQIFLLQLKTIIYITCLKKLFIIKSELAILISCDLK